MSSKVLALFAAVFFLYAAVGACLIAPHNALKSRGSADLPMQRLPKKQIILQIELARSEDDIRMVLKPGDLAPNLIAQNIKDARAGNLLDSFVFIPGYAGFLLFLGLLLAREQRQYAKGLFLLAVIAVPVAAICDELENCGIAKTLQHFETKGDALPGDALNISTPSIVKWLLTLVVTLAYGIASILPRIDWKRLVLGLLLLATAGWIANLLTQYAFERFGHA